MKKIQVQTELLCKPTENEHFALFIFSKIKISLYS